MFKCHHKKIENRRILKKNIKIHQDNLSWFKVNPVLHASPKSIIDLLILGNRISKISIKVKLIPRTCNYLNCLCETNLYEQRRF